ncbi:MAG: PAS domain S-box protein [Candidatus Lokiarchaeota archaeon]|nr:PAS domain S-box protein [Candidatus Lokiarchaeota archaeon]MBD3201593.1 PAS domain S-box protein [Candidatus Lokiarchaeota archaeon]
MSGFFIDANAIALDKMGYNKDEIIKLNLRDLLDKEEYERALNSIKKLIDRGEQIETHDYKVKKKDGDYLYIDAYGIPIKKKGKIYAVLGIGKDMTERRKLTNELSHLVKDKERELKTKHIYYQNIFENANDLIAILDKNFEHEYINRHYEEILGYNKNELLGKPPAIYVYPEDLKIARRTTLEGVKKGEAKSELRYRAKNGEVLWFELKGKFFKTSNGEQKSLIISRDISERKETEATLKESEKKYRSLFKNIPEGFAFHKLIYDENHSPIDYIFLEINATFEKITGLKKKNLIGKRITEVLPGIEEDPTDWIGTYGNVSFTGESIRFESFSQPLQRWYNVLAYSPKEEYFVTLFRDITEKKVAEKQLRGSEEKYRLLMENSPYSIILLDQEGVILDCNPATTDITSYDKEELVKKKFFELNIFDTNDIPFKLKGRFERLKEGALQEPMDFIIKTKDKRNVWVKTTSIVYTRKGKKFIQTILTDITEQKRREKLQEEFNKKLEGKVKSRTQKLEEALKKQKLYMKEILKASQFKSQFMASMSHELRTPLNIIIGFTELILEGEYGELGQQQKEYMEDILSSAEHLLDMIRDILDISKIEGGMMQLELKDVSLDKLISQIVSEFIPLLKKKSLNIKFKGINKYHRIIADPIKLKSILYNLISNAIKFTIKGLIHIKVEDMQEDWVFHIEDTGIGISEEEQEIVFKEFKRSHSEIVRKIPGTGLGLPLTKRLINLHGGEIWFHSEAGKGTTFSFTIPKNFKEKKRKTIESFLNKL